MATPDSEAYRIAQELSDTPISKLKEDQINRLVETVTEESNKNRHDLANRIEGRLVELGETGDTNKITWSIINALNGNKIYQVEQNLINNSAAANNIINEIKGVPTNQSTVQNTDGAVGNCRFVNDVRLGK